MELPKTLLEAIQYFSDEQVCIDAVALMRWPDGKAVCPDCCTGNPYYLASQKRWKCRKGLCGRQFSVKVGTIFEDSPISLKKWLPAMWLICNCKNGISSHELHRDLGVTQKTAWFMLQRLRLALQNGPCVKLGGPESGPVEVDETFVGGKLKNMHVRRRERMKKTQASDNKMPVMGMLDRETRKVRLNLIPDVTRETLQEMILEHIEKGSTVYTDDHSGYRHMDAKTSEFVHASVNHIYEYVRGEVHTNGIENFWSLFKRMLNGTYVAVEPFHLAKYAGEQAFRFNNRATKDNPLTDYDRFMLALSQISGKRLTYADLTGKTQERPEAS
jgi:transposase-like protein